ncbi:MAG: choice-of-anchor Q domain-containing protein, partial [Planctomycetota bacterium]
FEDCDFLENSADAAAALELHGEITIERCRFIGNRPAEDPGFETTCTIFLSGAINRYDDPIVIRDCEFRDNGGPEAPAGWSELECFFNGNYSRGGSLTVERSRFIGNRGGVLLSPRNAPDNMPFATFADCEIVGNGRPNVGFGNTVFRHCTFANNGNEPGSLWQFSGTAGEVTNCIVDHEFDDGQGSPLFRETVTVSRSVLPAAVPGASNSNTLDPLFIRNPSDGGDGWGDNPSTPDIDESLNDDFGDLRLRPGSPAIDAGTNDVFTPGDVDLDGNPRLADDPGIPGNNVDIGAYEFQGTTCLADVNQDGVADPADFNAWVAAYNDGSPLADQNRDGVVNPADFNAWVRNLNAGCP